MINDDFNIDAVTMNVNLICDNDTVTIDVIEHPENVQYVHFFLSLDESWGQYGFIFVTVKSDDKTTWHIVNSGDVVVNLFPFATLDNETGMYLLPDSLDVSICGRSEFVGEKNSKSVAFAVSNFVVDHSTSIDSIVDDVGGVDG